MGPENGNERSIRCLRFSWLERVFCFEACHLTGRSCGLVLGPATHDDSHRGIVAEALGIVNVFIACQPAVERLAKEGQQTVLGVLAGAGVVQAAGRGGGQSKGVVEFAVRKESGITGDGRAVELQLDLTVEVNAEGVVLAVTHKVPRSERRGIDGNAGVSRR